MNLERVVRTTARLCFIGGVSLIILPGASAATFIYTDTTAFLALKGAADTMGPIPLRLPFMPEQPENNPSVGATPVNSTFTVSLNNRRCAMIE